MHPNSQMLLLHDSSQCLIMTKRGCTDKKTKVFFLEWLSAVASHVFAQLQRDVGAELLFLLHKDARTAP